MHSRGQFLFILISHLLPRILVGRSCLRHATPHLTAHPESNRSSCVRHTSGESQWQKPLTVSYETEAATIPDNLQPQKNYSPKSRIHKCQCYYTCVKALDCGLITTLSGYSKCLCLFRENISTERIVATRCHECHPMTWHSMLQISVWWYCRNTWSLLLCACRVDLRRHNCCDAECTVEPVTDKSEAHSWLFHPVLGILICTVHLVAALWDGDEVIIGFPPFSIICVSHAHLYSRHIPLLRSRNRISSSDQKRKETVRAISDAEKYCFL